MKITDVLVLRVSVPRPRPVRTAIHSHAHADTVVAEMPERPDLGLDLSPAARARGKA